MDHKLFEYAVFYQPSEEEEKTGIKPKILIKPETILATEEKNALIIVSRNIPEAYLDRLNNVKVVLRPF